MNVSSFSSLKSYVKPQMPSRMRLILFVCQKTWIKFQVVEKTLLLLSFNKRNYISCTWSSVAICLSTPSRLAYTPRQEKKSRTFKDCTFTSCRHPFFSVHSRSRCLPSTVRMSLRSSQNSWISQLWGPTGRSHLFFLLSQEILERLECLHDWTSKVWHLFPILHVSLS